MAWISQVPQGDGFAAALRRRWADPRTRDSDCFLLAVIAALLLHALPVVMVAGGWGIGGPVSVEVRAGDPAGSKDGVSVEVIDAAEYDRRYVSFSKGRDAADAAPAPSAARQPQPQQPAPSPPQPKSEVPAREAPGPVAAPRKVAPPAKLSEADIAEILENARQDLEGSVSLSSQASLARQGQASDYVKGVMRRLKQTMPKPSGLKGSVVIGIIMSPAGAVAWVGVLKSSGVPMLDTLVAERVRSTQFTAPANGVPPGERTFQVTYEYR